MSDKTSEVSQKAHKIDWSRGMTMPK
jgi:hypothetical protein